MLTEPPFSSQALVAQVAKLEQQVLEAQAENMANKAKILMLVAQLTKATANEKMYVALDELATEAVKEMAPYTSLDTPLPSPSSKSTPPASPLATITNKKIRSFA